MDFKDLEMILFEPWALGDAVIASSVARLRPEKIGVCCHPRWISLLKNISGMEVVHFFPVELPYTYRSDAQKSKYALWKNAVQTQKQSFKGLVLSTRGDIRDTLSMRFIFSDSRVKTSGWFRFLARRIAVLDFMVRVVNRLLKRRIQNRYEAWCELCRIPVEILKDDYLSRKEKNRIENQNSNQLLIHAGAQWKSRVYPHFLELSKELKVKWNVLFVRGPGDANLSEGVEIPIVAGEELMEKIRKSKAVLANDSGIMHVAAADGAEVFCFSRISNFDEWCPPFVKRLEKEHPTGYAPHSEYATDHQVTGWLSTKEAAQLFLKQES